MIFTSILTYSSIYLSIFTTISSQARKKKIDVDLPILIQISRPQSSQAMKKKIRDLFESQQKPITERGYRLLYGTDLA